MHDTTLTDDLTAAQLRSAFEERIGATPDNHSLWSALDRVIVATCDERDERNHEEVAVLARHFPGLERAILAVWHHVTRIDDDGPCGHCEPAPPAVGDAS